MRLIPLVCLLAFASGAKAEVVPVAANDDGCLVYPLSEVRTTARWSGPCKDGYADGEGTLEWFAKGSPGVKYKGTMQRGRPHGVGYTLAQDNSQYEGEFVEGRREGFGIAVDPIGDRYDGQWKGGRREGQGKMVYAVGGSYEGAWRDDKYHGKGTIVYAGGRRAEYEFVDGHWPDKIVVPGQRQAFTVKRADATHGSIRSDDIAARNLPLPAHLNYAQMTPEQKVRVATHYPLMDPADEPPYPANGQKKLFQTLAQISGMGSGAMTVLVTVGPDGKAQSLTTIGSPSANTTKVVQYAFMLEPYKPAKCAGTPCTMVYALRFQFDGYN